MGYSFRLAAGIICIHRQDNTYHKLCYTSNQTLAGTRQGMCTTTITMIYLIFMNVIMDSSISQLLDQILMDLIG